MDVRNAKQSKTGGPRPGPSPAYPQSRRRVWVFRLAAAILGPVLALASLEAVLRFAGLGAPTGFFLSMDLPGGRALIQNDRFGWRFLGRRMSRTPHPFLLPQTKAPGTVRVFVLGESAAYGDPQPAFGLARVLEVLLRDRFPGLRFEVVNAAMTAINSHAILPIARDCARQNGDLWVLYMGNNEVVGPYGAGTVFGRQSPPLALIRTGLALKATRIGQLVDTVRDRFAKGQAGPGEWGGMAMFMGHQVRHDDRRMEAVYAHFERNLSETLDAGLRGGARIVVCTVAANLKDCAPFGSLHRTDLSDQETAQWGRHYEAALEAHKAGRHAQAVEAFGRAAQIDGTYAELQFRWAQSCLALGQESEALRRFSLARDYDTLRFRSDARLNDLVHEVCRGLEQRGCAIVDGQATLASHSPNGIVGHELLHEHVHLRFEGNYLLAIAIADQAARLLPQVAAEASPQSEWLSAEDCARRLAYT
ncbi:MAG: tetratricopeptide repeat protein, partial [Phycisphaerae bacterium]|nr:tetratricopeptide repeat protein [Phycisphaerae bacterium]